MAETGLAAETIATHEDEEVITMGKCRSSFSLRLNVSAGEVSAFVENSYI
jgi:hypothetical protein